MAQRGRVAASGGRARLPPVQPGLERTPARARCSLSDRLQVSSHLPACPSGDVSGTAARGALIDGHASISCAAMEVEVRTRSNDMRLPRWACGAFAIAIAVLLTATGATAQPSPPADARTASSEARAHFERGVSFYEETDYAAALVEFKRAYTLSPTWQVLFNIGQSYFQVRRYAEALVTLTQFLEEGQDRIPEPRRSTVEAERADLANRVGHARISSNVAGARVTIDDTDVGVTPLTAPTLVSVGVRTIRAVTPGNAPVEQEVSVPAGETVAVHLAFPEAAPAPPAPLSPAVAARATPAAPAPSAGRGPA